MKKRFFWFTYIVSSLSAFSIWLMMIIQGSAAFSWSDFIQIVIPVFILTLLLTIIFTHVMWQPIDQFMESQPEYTDIEKDSIVKILQRIMQRYDSALFENQNRLSILLSLMNHLQEGVVIINQDEKIDFHNSAAASILHFSIQPSEKWLYEVIRSTELMDRIRKTIHERKQFLGEAKLIIPQETTVLYTIVPLTKQANQSGWKALLLIQDITSIRKLEKVRTDFIGNVSHELKSPLTAMLGYSELLASAEKIDPERQKHYSQILHHNVVRLIDIVNDLLILTKIESGESLQKTTFSLFDLIRELEELLKKKLSDKNLQMKILIDKTITLHADKIKIRQVLINLLDNAVKFTKEQGIITVSATKDNGKILISVQDNGIGIPYVEQSRIFERFYQVDKARTGEVEGTGLGLSIVKHIVEDHGGNIKLESELGKGSRFTVILPE